MKKESFGIVFLSPLNSIYCESKSLVYESARLTKTPMFKAFIIESLTCFDKELYAPLSSFIPECLKCSGNTKKACEGYTGFIRILFNAKYV